MSASFGLVRFKTTGNIYYCCYEGTSDVMLPYICTPEECYDKQYNCYCAISYCRALCANYKNWTFPNNVADLDDVEIYADYGDGFYWNGTGSESIKMIKDFLAPWESDIDVTDGAPTWVKEFLEKE